jgi:hypothetical protein
MKVEKTTRPTPSTVTVEKERGEKFRKKEE